MLLYRYLNARRPLPSDVLIIRKTEPEKPLPKIYRINSSGFSIARSKPSMLPLGKKIIPLKKPIIIRGQPTETRVKIPVEKLQGHKQQKLAMV